LLVVPGLERPFSSPKLVLLGVMVLAGFLWAGRRLLPAWHGLPILVQVSLLVLAGALGLSAADGVHVSIEALGLPLMGMGWLLAICALRPRVEHLALALAASGALVAAVALAQCFGLDPFGALGWVPVAQGAQRMRLYSTLGNPNFVAAFLVALLPVTLAQSSVQKRAAWWIRGPLVVQFAALAMTRSRAALLGLAGATVWLLLARTSRRTLVWALVAALLVGVVLLVAADRPLERALEGRFYVWRIVAANLADCGFSGCGPGSFETRFARWETEWWGSGAGAAADRRFSGLQDHAHNDYLELLVEQGVAGLLGFLGFLAGVLWLSRRRGEELADGVSRGATAGIAALACVALVDFPMARPETVFVFWTLAGIVVAQSQASSATAADANSTNGRAGK
jgi:putative inorganic carbon (HCO3(-)) transporter